MGWADFVMLNQPLQLIQEYFGHQIAWYFDWLDFYSGALWIPALL